MGQFTAGVAPASSQGAPRPAIPRVQPRLWRAPPSSVSMVTVMLGQPLRTFENPGPELAGPSRRGGERPRLLGSLRFFFHSPGQYFEVRKPKRRARGVLRSAAAHGSERTAVTAARSPRERRRPLDSARPPEIWAASRSLRLTDGEVKDTGRGGIVGGGVCFRKLRGAGGPPSARHRGRQRPGAPASSELPARPARCARRSFGRTVDGEAGPAASRAGRHSGPEPPSALGTSGFLPRSPHARPRQRFRSARGGRMETT